MGARGSTRTFTILYFFINSDPRFYLRLAECSAARPSVSYLYASALHNYFVRHNSLIFIFRAPLFYRHLRGNDQWEIRNCSRSHVIKLWYHAPFIRNFFAVSLVWISLLHRVCERSSRGRFGTTGSWLVTWDWIPRYSALSSTCARLRARVRSPRTQAPSMGCICQSPC